MEARKLQQEQDQTKSENAELAIVPGADGGNGSSPFCCLDLLSSPTVVRKPKGGCVRLKPRLSFYPKEEPFVSLCG